MCCLAVEAIAAVAAARLALADLCLRREARLVSTWWSAG